MISVKAELHCHTNYSDGVASPEECIWVAKKKGIKVLAITDHNTADGALPYWQNPIQNDVIIIPGEEVSTDRGHVLVYFLRKTIKPGKLEDVIATAHEQDAICYMAHPYHIPLFNHFRKKNILKLQPDYLQLLTGIEVENGHNRSRANRMAVEMAKKNQLRMIAGSDAHLPFEIGNAVTLLDINDFSLQGVRDALQFGANHPVKRKFNGYSIYLLIGLLNKISQKRYS